MQDPGNNASTAYVAYLRDSGGDNQDLSIQEQSSVIQRYCTEHGLILLHTYADIATPGSTVIGRNQFLQMVADLRANHYPGCAGLIVWNISRFSRDVDDSQYYKSDLRRRGYHILSINDNIPTGLDGRIFEALIEWKNAKYLDELSADVRRGLQHNLNHYGAISGTPPRGFRRSQPITLGERRNGKTHQVHRWEPIPELIPVIQLAWRMRSLGKTYRAISAACGSLYRSDAGWIHFFQNPIYKGELHYGNITIPDYCPPIIDPATWAIVQEINSRNIQQRTAANEHPRRARSSYILSGLLTCAHCGAPLNGETIYSKVKNHTNRYYSCSRKKRTHGVECQAYMLPQQLLEDLILNELSQHVYTLTNLNEIRSAIPVDASAEQAALQQDLLLKTKSLASTRQKIANIITALENGPSRALTNRLAELEAAERTDLAEIARINNRISILQQPIEPIDVVVKSIRAALLDTAREKLREQLRTLIDHIEVQRTANKITGTIYYYKPDKFMSMELSRRSGSVFTHKLDHLVHPA